MSSVIGIHEKKTLKKSVIALVLTGEVRARTIIITADQTKKYNATLSIF